MKDFREFIGKLFLKIKEVNMQINPYTMLAGMMYTLGFLMAFGIGLSMLSPSKGQKPATVKDGALVLLGIIFWPVTLLVLIGSHFWEKRTKKC